jgi:hypothetical protein
LTADAEPKTAFDTDRVLDALKQVLAERALNAEMDQHLNGFDSRCNGNARESVIANAATSRSRCHGSPVDEGQITSI